MRWTKCSKSTVYENQLRNRKSDRLISIKEIKSILKSFPQRNLQAQWILPNMWGGNSINFTQNIICILECEAIKGTLPSSFCVASMTFYRDAEILLANASNNI